MPYIGNPSAQRFTSPRAASVYSGDGSTVAFTLEEAVTTDEDILVSVDGVIQEPSVAYAVSSGTTLTFTAAPSSNSGNNIFVYYIARTLGSVSMPDGQNVNAAVGSFSGTLTTTGAFTSIGIDDNADATAITIDSSEDVTLSGNLSTGVNKFIDIRDADGHVSGRLRNVSGSNNALTIEADPDNSASGTYISFKVDTTEVMKIDNIGALTIPYQPAFQAKPGAAQNNMAVGSEVTIVLGTEIFDNNADFASNSFTAPVTGKYRFDVSLRLGAVDQASEYYLTRLNTSNRNHDMIVDSNEFSSDLDYLAFTFSVLTDMDANDTATLKFYQNSGAAQTDVDQSNTRLSGNLVC